MTLWESCIEDLMSNGLAFHQANQVMKSVAQANKSMAGRWDDDVEGYPDELFAALSLSIDRHALEYIDINCPEAWFRPMFVHTCQVTEGKK